MDLTTRCPQCGTVFTATLEQLQLRKGYIRCVSCAHIFDGYDAVVPGGEAPVSAPPAPPAAPIAPPADATRSMPSVLRQRQGKKEPVFATGLPSASESLRAPPSDAARPAFSISTTRQISQDSSRQDPVFRVDDLDPDGNDPVVVRSRRPEPVLRREPATIAPAQPRIPQPGQHAPASTGTQPPVPKIYVEPRSPATTGDHRQAHDIPAAETRSYRSMASVFWSVLIVAGLVLLLAQLAYVYRAQLAQHVPAVRPLLVQACVQLACEVPYSRQINQISIMSSSLRATAGGATGAPGAAAPAGDPTDSMTLQLTLRNTYDKPQEWPTLVLDLTDFSGTLVVRRNLSPSSYLTPDLLQQPFAASSEVTVGVPIVLNGLKVNGYQLGKFFP